MKYTCVLNNSSRSIAAVPTDLIALQTSCRQLLKSCIFKGLYLERRYVENVNGYRDIVCLQKSESKFDKSLREMLDQLQQFYNSKNNKSWIGITCGALKGIIASPSTTLETQLWVELNDLAFGQYWFSVKDIQFRNNEIILQIKMMQPVEEEEASQCTLSAPVENATLKKEININDFILLFRQWWTSIKQMVYDFLVQDISRENIKEFLRVFFLFIATTISFAVMGIKYLGLFVIDLTRVLTPIILKLIDLLSKIIGGFFILLTMIWRDLLSRNRPVYTVVDYRTINKRMPNSYQF